jgi:hypothetical protein
METQAVRIGCGSSCDECRLEEAVRLAASGLVDYLVFDRLSEWVTAHHHLERHRTGEPVFDPDFKRYMEALLPIALRNGVKIVTNAGGDDPEAALASAEDLAVELGIELRIVAPRSERLLDLVRSLDPIVLETGKRLSELEREAIGVSVYRGGRQVSDGLDAGADLVITNRVGDSALYLGALVHGHGWEWTDWDTLARGMGVGHLLECGPQVTGGCFAAPPYKIVPNLASVGLPYAEVRSDGSAVITKMPETGGMVTVRTCKEQLLYEVGDPARYMHDDVIVDFTTTRLSEDGHDRVRVEGTSGLPRPPQLKALVSTLGGFMAEAYILMAGADALARAELVVDVVRDRIRICGLEPIDLRLSVVGAGSTCGVLRDPMVTIREVMLHAAARFETREEAELFAVSPSGPVRAASDVYGPAGTNRARSLAPQVAEIAAAYSVLLPRDALPEPSLRIIDTRAQALSR